MKKKLDNEINLQRYIYDSFSKVYFELKNLSVPFYGLYNIRLEQGDNKSNIDFLMVTNQFCCIINCKSHQGNIEIDSQGNFSRWVKKGEKSVKEGMYSPVEENRKTELILKSILNNQGLEKLPILSLTVFTSPKAWIQKNSVNYMIKVKGDSMINANINDGDLIVIRQQNTANSHEIVAVDLDGNTTLKRFIRMGDTIILMPENPGYEPINVTEHQMNILGVAVGVVKNI